MNSKVTNLANFFEGITDESEKQPAGLWKRQIRKPLAPRRHSASEQAAFE